jgi:hypothetical protein
MFNCHCQDTMGRYIKISPTKKIWICDCCKGCREIAIRGSTVRKLIVVDPNYAYLLQRHRALLLKSTL